VTAAELADRLGLEYEQLTAGEYKDAGFPLKELEDHEREYLQGIIDDYYEKFISDVAQRREIDPEELEATEARVYLGTQAAENGLVDELGTREDVVDELESRLGKEVTVQEFEPTLPFATRLQTSARQFAYAFGAGIASRFVGAENQYKLR
jgi:protease-4